jgi:hypothetical protein
LYVETIERKDGLVVSVVEEKWKGMCNAGTQFNEGEKNENIVYSSTQVWLKIVKELIPLLECHL